VQQLLDRGADVGVRDYGDNNYALHFAADAADFDAVSLLVEAGSDVVGGRDDHQIGVLGWATCFARVREDVAACISSPMAPSSIPGLPLRSTGGRRARPNRTRSIARQSAHQSPGTPCMVTLCAASR